MGREYNPLIPKSISFCGDNNLGEHKSNCLIWDMDKDNYLLYSKLRPQVININSFYKKKGYGSFIYSLVLPGLGDYFVSDYRNLHFKPYLRTLSSVAFLTLGIIANSKIYREPQYSIYVNPRTNQEELTFNGYGEKKYWLFKYDNVLFLGAGISIWVYDIIWVASVGGRNSKLKRALDDFSVTTNAFSKGVTLNYNLKF
ncbi:hypothetical protein [Tenuifilum thalassicum]|uniref:DUF5683 domain-containing protein n=1 Tax=Tenuifilum thalassicum TaxID=2590900 RepID=A0A7D4BKR6_9BACT|nr:hypothetical protein [Tenuifilum thalassicum]QKG80399.1 hypothetical protein FHG85_09025 [Tenuifilum thalassicum]